VTEEVTEEMTEEMTEIEGAEVAEGTDQQRSSGATEKERRRQLKGKQAPENSARRKLPP
jgi:hypothetical protein